jgi:hypothetical protein
VLAERRPSLVALAKGPARAAHQAKLVAHLVLAQQVTAELHRLSVALQHPQMVQEGPRL